MKQPRTYTIVKTFIDKHGHIVSGQTGITGGSMEDAIHAFTANVAAAAKRPNLMGVVLVDAAENVVAEWTKKVERAA